MAGETTITKLFSEYRHVYGTGNGDKFRRHEKTDFTSNRLNKVCHNQQGEAYIKECRNSSLGRVACWLEDHVVSFFRRLGSNRHRQRTHPFTEKVIAALEEAGVENADHNPTIRKIDRHLRNKKPLREKFVMEVLRDVAKQTGTERDDMPWYAKPTFRDTNT